MSLLVSLPEGLDSEALLEECALEGVLYSPGRWFFVNGGSGHLRLCFGNVAAEDIERGVERLGRVVRRAAKRGREVSRRSRDAVLPQV
jgi:DNA-binding transcriptional MocR family regulator